MVRVGVWTIGIRKWFQRIAILPLVIACALWYFDSELAIVRNVGDTVIFSVAGAFPLLTGREAMLGVLEEIRRQQYQQGYETGKMAALEQLQEEMQDIQRTTKRRHRKRHRQKNGG